MGRESVPELEQVALVYDGLRIQPELGMRSIGAPVASESMSVPFLSERQWD